MTQQRLVERWIVKQEFGTCRTTIHKPERAWLGPTYSGESYEGIAFDVYIDVFDTLADAQAFFADAMEA